jgi:hypothetical protein
MAGQAPDRPTEKAGERAAEKPPELPRRDAFEGNRFKSTADAHKLDEAFAHAATPSGIDSLVRLLDAARTQLAAEHRALRAQSQAIVEQLVQAGFSPEQLARARAELQELRKKMAALRKRLQHLQRRLKSAYASAGKTGDASFAKLLGAQLERLRKLGPGVSRALLALQTIEQAYAAFADGSVPVLRLDVRATPAERRELLGRALTAVAPGAAIARATLSLLRDGPEADLSAEGEGLVDEGAALWSRGLLADAPDPLDGPRALTLALVPPPGGDRSGGGGER